MNDAARSSTVHGAPLGLIGLARQFGVYLLAGGGAAAANFAAGALFRATVTGGLAYPTSVVLGMAVGALVAFFLHRTFTFAVADEPAAPQAVRFTAVAVGGVLITVGFAEMVVVLWSALGSPVISRAMTEHVAHAAAIGVNAVYGFLALKFFALKRRGAFAR
jgi:putative flippase GtrA